MWFCVFAVLDLGDLARATSFIADLFWLCVLHSSVCGLVAGSDGHWGHHRASPVCIRVEGATHALRCTEGAWCAQLKLLFHKPRRSRLRALRR